MICSKCTSTIADGSRFCAHCGAPVAGEKTAAKGAFSEAASDLLETGKVLSQNTLAKKIAAGAAIGAVVALPVPIIGWAAGAVIGGGIVAYKQMTKR